MEMGEIKELLLNELTKEQKYLLNTKQSGEAWELLGNLGDNSASLVFLDPQYEPVKNVLSVNYPLSSQSDYQILRILEQIERVLKPSAFYLLWLIDKKILEKDKIIHYGKCSGVIGQKLL